MNAGLPIGDSNIKVSVLFILYDARNPATSRERVYVYSTSSFCIKRRSISQVTVGDYTVSWVSKAQTSKPSTYI